MSFYNVLDVLLDYEVRYIVCVSVNQFFYSREGKIRDVEILKEDINDNVSVFVLLLKVVHYFVL